MASMANWRSCRRRRLPSIRPSLSWAEAAAIWMQYATAYGAMIDIANLKAGDTILIPAASSSVGIAAIQIANLVGATPIALTRREQQAHAAAGTGAKHVIATEEQDVVAEVQKLTGGKGARVVFDPVGGPTVEKLAAAMAEQGILFLYGALSTEPDTAAAVRGVGQIAHDPRLPAVRDHERSRSGWKRRRSSSSTASRQENSSRSSPRRFPRSTRSSSALATWSRTSRLARSWSRCRNLEIERHHSSKRSRDRSRTNRRCQPSIPPCCSNR